MRNFLVFMFALAAGLCVSGIVANLYRLIVPQKAQSNSGRLTYYIVMSIAGPTVLIDNAARAWRKKDCSAAAFWLAAALSSYWSFIIGLFAMNVALIVF